MPIPMPSLRHHAALLLCAITGLAGAANLQVSPVMVNFRSGQIASGISLQNMGAAPVYGQVRVYLWDQQNGDDVLTPTQEVVASPPIVQIAAQASQTVRLVRTVNPAAAGERSYRMLIDEISPEGAGVSNGVDIRLRYSVPVFVPDADQQAHEVLVWRVFRKEGEWHMEISNSGRKHAQIGAMSLVNRAGKEFEISKGLMGYALAGRVREWRLPLDKRAELDGVLTVRALVNTAAVTATSISAD